MWKLEYKSLKSCQQQRRNGGLPVDIQPVSIYPSHVNVNQDCHSE